MVQSSSRPQIHGGSKLCRIYSLLKIILTQIRMSFFSSKFYIFKISFLNSPFFQWFRELDLSANLLRGPLTHELLPNSLKSLESLNLGTNLFTSIHTGAFEKFPFLTRLSLRHNQIDVLEDHAFSGLSSLQVLDLSYNGIVAVSGASLKHLSRLLVLNLTHNFLRYVSNIFREFPRLYYFNFFYFIILIWHIFFKKYNPFL